MKKKKVLNQESLPESPAALVSPSSKSTSVELNSGLDKLYKGWIPYLLIAVLGFAIYANTFSHEYALDDELVVCGNNYVLQGFAGIGDIMTKDLFDSRNKELNSQANMAGGRYRPFSVATFAVEQQFIGTMPQGISDSSWDSNQNKVGEPEEDVNKDGLFNDRDSKTKGMAWRHVNNVLLYILSICLLYLFLSSYFFKENKIAALLISLLFLVHPLHTEVVANVKSRDEILSFLFLVLTMHFAFKYVETKSGKMVLWASICYFIGLLSKEYGAVMLIILPVSIYTYYSTFKWSQTPMLWLGMGVAFLIYFMMRSNAVSGFEVSELQDSELLNNPYLLASEAQAWATKIYINLKYFILMLIPVNLSCDYNYNAIPYKSMTDWEVWLGALLLIGLVGVSIWSWKKRSVLIIPILIILLPLLMVNNFFFNIGATMGERLVYHSSLGVCILLISGGFMLVKKGIFKPIVLVLICIPIIALYSVKTIARNPAWKNNITLYTTDVKTYPESSMLTGNACVSYLDLSKLPANKNREKILLDSATQFGLKAVQLHPKHYVAYSNLGLVKIRQEKKDSALFFWLKAKELAPYDQNIAKYLEEAAGGYYNEGVKAMNAGDLNAAQLQMEKSRMAKPKDHRSLYFAGLIHFKKGEYVKAKQLWNEAIALAPGDPILTKALQDVANY